MLSLESTSSRMSNLARQELYFDEFMSLDEMLERIEMVKRDEVQKIAQEFFRPEGIALTMLGRLGEVKLTRADLNCP
jgi:predicted Zn-dependent peptidase